MAVPFWSGFILLVLQMITLSDTAGILEVQLLSFSNDFSKDLTGSCCRDPIAAPKEASCQNSCSPFFRICLKQWQNPVQPDAPCYFGSRLTQVFSGLIMESVPKKHMVLNFTQWSDYRESMKFPFSFNWPGTFSLIVEAWHGSTNSTSVNSTNSSQTGTNEKQLLIRVAELRELKVSSEWTQESHANDYSRLDLRYRVVCDESYYGEDCSRYCRPRDDHYGHHVCAADGRKQCMAGWTGSLCNKAVCAPGCHSENGHCSVPGECQCYLGYQGQLCDRCVRYPGCVHGTCQRAFECQCDEGWGGLFCNQDLNFCTHHKPCQNGATCTNTGSGHYTCRCRPGFTGANCEHRIETCDQKPCMNGGRCKQWNTNYTCSCPSGFSGRHCQSNAQSCADKPCEHGGSCIDFAGGYQCVCPPGFEGTNCDMEQDECDKNPCLNGGTCINRRTSPSPVSPSAPYECSCPTGYSGVNCEININDCSIQPCLNGGSCIDLVGSFKCRCPPGFMGVICQYNIDDCLKRPCANGGTCFDLINDYRCMCRPGFRGKDCSIDINECESNPCRNGGTCVDGIDSYQCRCPLCYAGVNCQQRNDDCTGAMDSKSPGSVIVYNTSSPNFFGYSGHEQANHANSADRSESQLIMIGVPVLIVCILIVVVLAAVVSLLYRRNKQRQRNGQPSIAHLESGPYQKCNNLKSHNRIDEATDRFCQIKSQIDCAPDESPNLAQMRRHQSDQNVNLVQPNYYKIVSVEKLSFGKREARLKLEFDTGSQTRQKDTSRTSDLGTPESDHFISQDTFDTSMENSKSVDSGLASPVTRSCANHDAITGRTIGGDPVKVSTPPGHSRRQFHSHSHRLHSESKPKSPITHV